MNLWFFLSWWDYVKKVFKFAESYHIWKHFLNTASLASQAKTFTVKVLSQAIWILNVVSLK